MTASPSSPPPSTITEAVWLRSRHKGGSRLVLLAIARRLDRGESPAIPVRLLEGDTGLSRPQVFAILRSLEESGELAVERDFRSRVPNVYGIRLDGAEG